MPRQRRFGSSQDADEVFHGTIAIDAVMGKRPCSSGMRSLRLRDVECARAMNSVVGADHAVARCWLLHDRKDSRCTPSRKRRAVAHGGDLSTFIRKTDDLLFTRRRVVRVRRTGSSDIDPLFSLQLNLDI